MAIIDSVYKVNYGSTVIFAFTPQQNINGNIQTITPDSVSAELNDKNLNKIADLNANELDGVYYVACQPDEYDTSLYEFYYITFKWAKDGQTIIERVKFYLVPEGGDI